MAGPLRNGIQVIRGRKSKTVRPPKAKPIRRLMTKNPLWSIQVGRFHQFALAHRAITSAAHAVPALVSTPTAIFSDEGKSGRILFRPQIMGLSEASARRSCKALLNRNFACLPLPAETEPPQQGSR